MKIIIPFKETSNRCPNKNFILFPYALKWLENEGVDLREDVFVISKSKKVEYTTIDAKMNFMHEPETSTSDIDAIAYAMEKLDAKYAIFFPLTQPLKAHGILTTIEDILKQTSCDFVTTYQNITDRSLFYLNDDMNFLRQSNNRKGCMCNEMKMLDGAIYGVKKDFMDKVLKAEDINAAFWAGNFKAIKNEVDFFIDIDTANDMHRFAQLSSNYFQA